mmetsp:Transcript_5307/g.10375  ORF Transcript_5307/g.10375 Transcript_5307/m.10375 type:complete len:844 (-) Transcript_5307:112-2643(-)
MKISYAITSVTLPSATVSAFSSRNLMLPSFLRSHGQLSGTQRHSNTLISLASSVSNLQEESTASNENIEPFDDHVDLTFTQQTSAGPKTVDVDKPLRNKISEAQSEIEKFVSDFRELYNDLENAGGSIRRQMSMPGNRNSHSVSFTYVAPPSEYRRAKGDNPQLDGSWRLQSPDVYGDDANWKEMHRDITEKRMGNLPSAPPLLVYLPGLDGFGISATGQFDDLSSTFELWRMAVNKNNIDISFADLVKSVVSFITDATAAVDETPREVILVGESFGGLLSCAVAMALKKSTVLEKQMKLKGITLVNPATSFDETNWDQVVPLLTSLRYLESREEIVDSSGNFIFNNLDLPTPYSVLGGMALAATVPDSNQFSRIFDFMLRNVRSGSNDEILTASSDGFRLLAEYLPAVTLEQRVTKWLPVGTFVVNNEDRLSKLDVPTLVIAGKDDNVLPTKEEADRLTKLLPDCVKMDISGSGHFVLDNRVNLTEALLDSHIDPLDLQKKSPPYDPVTDWNLPPKEVIDEVIQKRVNPLRENTSPVFFSTDPVTGKRRRGLSLFPSVEGKPLLIVANHQLFGLDLGMIIAQLLEERGIVTRGLSHPVVSDGFSGMGSGSQRVQRRRYEINEDNPFGNDLFPMFGAVKVSPRNFYRLLQTNQTALLFPGGVKEALHGKDGAYKLFWPEKTDFVRVAAKFNATIVPLSAIGSADSAEILLDPSEMVELPFGIGDNLKNASASTTSARFDADNSDELFVPPLAVPKPIPARHYFLFGKAFDATSVDPKDKKTCQRVYENIRQEVQDGIDALLEARKLDPYALNGLRRNAYRRIFGKDPPTFPLESVKPSNNRIQ